MDALPATPGNWHMRASYAAPPVEFFDAIRICLKEKYATFSGRASRSEFWFFVLFVFLLTFVVQIILTVFFFLHFKDVFIAANAEAASSAMENTIGAAPFIIFAGFILFMLAFALPALAVATRRLHDTGRSGWWLLLPIVPYLGAILVILSIPAMGAASEAAQAAERIFTIAMLLHMASMLCGIVIVIFYCLPGQEHPNRFDR